MNSKVHDRLRAELDESMTAARSRVAKLADRVTRADTEANNLSASIRKQWQRRVALMRNGHTLKGTNQ